MNNIKSLTETENTETNYNCFVDISRFVMALLVVSIHTQPFDFNIWLDRGIGIITRFCVPFFFVISSYYFFIKKKSLKSYIIRYLLLYFFWVFVLCSVRSFDVLKIPKVNLLKLFLWEGYKELWFLNATIYATLIIYSTYKFLGEKVTYLISILLYLIGVFISTYSPLLNSLGLGTNSILSLFGYQNGLFYAPVFVAIGLYLALNKNNIFNITKSFKGLVISFILLIFESLIFVIIYKTKYRDLFLAMLPATYFLCIIIINTKFYMRYNYSFFLRKISSLIYLSHPIYLFLLKSYFSNNVFYFICVSLLSFLTGILIIMLSKKIYYLKFLY